MHDENGQPKVIEFWKSIPHLKKHKDSRQEQFPNQRVNNYWRQLNKHGWIASERFFNEASLLSSRNIAIPSIDSSRVLLYSLHKDNQFIAIFTDTRIMNGGLKYLKIFHINWNTAGLGLDLSYVNIKEKWHE